MQFLYDPTKTVTTVKSAAVLLVTALLVLVIFVMVVSASEITYGDVNDDGAIDVRDVVLVMQHILELKELSGDQLEAADVNMDGKVDVRDAILIMKYTLGLIEEFSKEVKVESVEEVVISVNYQTKFEDIDFPNSVKATLQDQTTRNLTVEWDESKSDPEYDPGSPGQYEFEGELVNLPEGVTNLDQVTAIALVTVKAQDTIQPPDPGEEVKSLPLEELNAIYNQIVPGAWNIIIPFDEAKAEFGATINDELELLFEAEVIAVMEYRTREADPQESFVALAVQAYTQQEVMEMQVRLKR